MSNECGVSLSYMVLIGNMIRDMIKSCHTCPIVPCGHKRVVHKCRVRVERHYDASGRLLPVVEASAHQPKE